MTIRRRSSVNKACIKEIRDKNSNSIIKSGGQVMKLCRSPQFFTLALLAFVTFGFIAVPHIQAEQIFSDNFPSTTLDSSKWISTISAPTIDDVGIGEPSPPYSLRLNGNPGGGDAVESRILDLSIYSSVQLKYWYEQTGGGDDPDLSGEDLIVEYWNGSTWVELERQLGAGPDMTSYVQSVISLPTAALHVGFRVRFRSVGTAGPYDDWFVDDIELTGDLLDDLRVTPSEGFISSGSQGGPFSPSSKTYTLTNTGGAALNWTAQATQPWLDVTPASGTLNPGNSNPVDIVINANANTLPPGTHTDTVTFTNTTSGLIQNRTVTLTVGSKNILAYIQYSDNSTSGEYQNTLTAIRSVGTNFTVTEMTNYTQLSTLLPGRNVLLIPEQENTSNSALQSIGTTWAATLQDFVNNGGVVIVCDYSAGYGILNGAGLMNITSSSMYFNQPVNVIAPDDPVAQGVPSTYTACDGSLYYTTTESRVVVQRTGYGPVVINKEIGPGNVVLIGHDYYASNAQQNRIVGNAVFNLPSIHDNLSVSPVADFNSSGNEGGPFTPASKNYTLTNIGPNSLDWTAAATTPWIDLDTSSGTLAPGNSVMIAVSFNANANSLSPGDYNDTVTFTNTTSGFVQTRQVTLRVIAIPGEIDVTDSIPPPDDLNMPFGEAFIGLSRIKQITITNTDPTYDLNVTDITFGVGYFEDFNDGLAQDWYEDIDQSWEVIAGEYRAQSSAGDFMMANYAAKQWDDLSVQMSCRRTGSEYTSAAVTLRVSSDFDDIVGSGYVFQIVTDGDYSIWKQVNGSWSWLQSWTGSPSITAGTNTLTAVAAGSSLKFFINSTLVWTGSDSALASGRIGLGGYTEPGYDATHYFDNVLVGKPLTSVQIISEEQLWYNQHSYEGGEPQAAPKDWVPPPYPGKNKLQQQPAQKTSTLSSDEAFRLENLPSLPLIIPPLGNVIFDVVFEPNFAKDYESSVVIKSNDADEPEVTVHLSGTGILDYLQIVPQQDFEFSGHPGGPFLPSNTYYYLTNNGMVNIGWTVTGPDWLNVSPLGGIIKPGETTKVKVAPNALARSKGEGVYVGQLLFTDVTTTAQQTRNVILSIFTEPKIWITPYSFDVNVYQGSGESENLAIGNGGDGLLNFILRGQQTGFIPASKPAVAVYDLMVETKKDVAAMAPAKHSFTAMTGNAAFAEGQMLVRFAPQADRKYPGLAAKNSILANASNGKLAAARVSKEYKVVRGLSLVKLPDNVAVKDALVMLNNTPGILYAEPDYQVKALSAGQTIPNDPRFSELWGMNNTGQNGGTPDADIDAPEAWDIATGSSNIIVAVIDTGVDYTHPDLAANMWVNAAEANGTPGFDDDGNGYVDDIYGYDFYNKDSNPMDDHGHGTHCSGTIGAIGNNGVGVAGVCWNVKIMALKFLNSSGGGYDSDAIECIQYAILMGANLSSNSWGGGGYSQALKDAIDAAGNANQLFVAAAGNDGGNNDTNPSYPASYQSNNIIAVLSTNRNDNISNNSEDGWASNYGPISVDIGAPGSNILSCQPGSNYQYMSGTSMATPHVSGAAALIWSFYPSMPYQEVKDLLIQTVDKIPSLAGLCVSEGRLNLYNAVNEVGVSWLEFVPQSGSVTSGEVNNVSVLFHGDVPVGTYQGQITVSTNDPYTPETNIPVAMTVEPLDYFIELFDAGDNDMANRTLTFIPNGSLLYYSLCTAPALEFPVNPAGGTAITLNDDDYYEVPLQGHTINFYGTSYDTFYIGSNGYITFESGDTHYLEQFTEHFALPRISALFDDLNPSAGGTISYKERSNSVVVTFQDVPEFSQATTNSFQVEIFFCGRIRITFLNIAAVDGLTGLSQGSGVPVYFTESNLSEYGLCGISAKVDFDVDCDVDFVDYAILANNWMDQNCAGPDWCDETDLNENGSVDLYDLAEFVKYWLEGL
jgi:subtilisin family serine protease